jgi:hypothetical protein
MIHTIYLTTNNKNGKIYVGYHATENPNDSYLGSGTLMLRAIKRYGAESFTKSILAEFYTKDEAEEFEAFIVDKEFTLRDDTYNINIGGNVRIAYGENNGFYGKHHSKENKNKTSIRSLGNKYFSDTHNYKIQNVETGDIYVDMSEAIKCEDIKSKWKLVYAVGEGRLKYLDDDRQDFTMELYTTRLASKKKNVERLAQSAKERFTGIAKNQEHKDLIGKGVREYIKTHPEEHTAKMLKINKNPDKIAKMAAKHRGMTRSDVARANMKKSQENRTWNPIKGRKAAYNPLTLEYKYFVTDADIPSDWIVGIPSRGNIYSARVFYNDGTIKDFKTLREASVYLNIIPHKKIHSIIRRPNPEKYGYRIEKTRI